MAVKPHTETDAEIEAIVHKVIGAAIERQKRVRLVYKNKVVGQGVVDLFVMDRLVVELKAQESVSEIRFAVARSYVRILNEPLGLMLNFHVPAMNDKRAIRRIIAGVSR